MKIKTDSGIEFDLRDDGTVQVYNPYRAEMTVDDVRIFIGIYQMIFGKWDGDVVFKSQYLKANTDPGIKTTKG